MLFIQTAEPSDTLDLVKGLADVGKDVVAVLDAYGEADEVRGDAGFAELLVGELAMGVAGRMEYTGASIGYVGDDGDEAQRVHELHGSLTVALESEGNDAAGTVGQVLLCQCVAFVARESAIVYPSNTRVVLQELGNTLGILTVTGYAQMQGLQSEVQKEGVLGSRDAAKVAHELCNELGGVGHLAEGLRVGQAVVGIVGGGEAWELFFARRRTVGSCGAIGVDVGTGVPVEVAAIDDYAANLRGMTVHVLGSGVGDDVGAPLEGTAVDRSGEGVVDDEGHAVLVGDACELLDVEDLTAWVADGLAEECLGVGTEGGRDLFLAGLL